MRRIVDLYSDKCIFVELFVTKLRTSLIYLSDCGAR